MRPLSQQVPERMWGDEASFVSGAALAVDGGYSASGPMAGKPRTAD